LTARTNLDATALVSEDGAALDSSSSPPLLVLEREGKKGMMGVE